MSRLCALSLVVLLQCVLLQAARVIDARTINEPHHHPHVDPHEPEGLFKEPSEEAYYGKEIPRFSRMTPEHAARMIAEGKPFVITDLVREWRLMGRE